MEVLFDGLNLSLRKGTGVATYARTLTTLAHQLGHEVGIVYEASRVQPKRALLREVYFFDAEDEKKKYGRLARIGHYFSDRWPFAQAVPGEIPVTGAVVTRQFASRMPVFDRLYADYRLFRRGRQKLRSWGSGLDLQLARRPDLFHATYPLPVRVPGAVNICTIHDLVPLRLPYTTLDHKGYHLKLLRWIARTFDHIVTVSESSRRDIISYLGVSEDRVTNTYQSVFIPDELKSKPMDDVAREIAGLFGLEVGNYLLYYGALEPKKNLHRLLEAYLSCNIKIPLILVGAQAWAEADEMKLFEQRRKELSMRAPDSTTNGVIRLLEYASFPTLVSLIRGARAILFPSLYEGFGLPVLEGMMLGTPVLTSTEASIPEIAGDAALLVDPYDVDAIGRGIRTLASDDSLCAELRRRGFEQARKFSIEIYEQRLKELYRRVMGSALVTDKVGGIAAAASAGQSA